MRTLEEIQDIIIIWGRISGNLDLVLLIQGKLSLVDYLKDAIKKETETVSEKEKQISIQASRITTTADISDIEERKEIIANLEAIKKTSTENLIYYKSLLEQASESQ